MVAALHNVSPGRGLFHSVRVDPSYRSGHHAKVQMVADGIRMPDLRLGTSDIALELFESRFDFPPGAIVLDDLLDAKACVG